MSQSTPPYDLTATRLPPAASLTRRMCCWFYEGLLLFGVIFIAGYLFGTLSQTKHALNNRHGLQAFVFLVLALYFTFFWHKGQTLAMKTWHLKITTLDGLALPQKQALLRYVFAWIWFVPPLALATLFDQSGIQALGVVVAWVIFWALGSKFHTDKQFWHDHWALTRIVDVRPELSQTSDTITP
ncbi:MAG: RDD family protein [Betaproteobacteria bacterium]|nr:RDD family protein [Betaproteobacteria bacterium]